MYQLMWFKSDLRVLDNPALQKAMNNGPTIAVYMLSDAQWLEHGISNAKKSLIIRQLFSLSSALKTLNVPLVVRATQNFHSLPAELLKLATDVSATDVYFNKEYELNERRCEQTLAELATDQGVSLHSYNDTCMVEPGLIRNKQGEPYKVFSAFKREFIKQSSTLIRPLYQAPKAQNEFDVASDMSALLEFQSCFEIVAAKELSISQRWPAGEDEAHSRLESFVENEIERYAIDRDIPGKTGTSSLSPYLAVGAISTRQCFQEIMQKDQCVLEAGGAHTWFNELVWREFYRHLMFDFPQICRFKPFKADTDFLPWRRDERLFDAWKNGQTGYPIVDAAMRQLQQTGWMHNRLRMVTAMFLCKHLFIDWRWGEAYFMSKLVDGDFASNNGGWQWSASTGVDAVPYFRIFNPTRQSQRFDADGAFIRRYIPELASLDNKLIHQPPSDQAMALGYCLPIVEHRQATRQTKFNFEQLKHHDHSYTLNGANQVGGSKHYHTIQQQEFNLG